MKADKFKLQRAFSISVEIVDIETFGYSTQSVCEFLLHFNSEICISHTCQQSVIYNQLYKDMTEIFFIYIPHSRKGTMGTNIKNIIQT